jgi:hypothetical protein
VGRFRNVNQPPWSPITFFMENFPKFWEKSIRGTKGIFFKFSKITMIFVKMTIGYHYDFFKFFKIFDKKDHVACQIFFALVPEFCLHVTSSKFGEVWVEFAHDVLQKKTSAAGEKIEDRLPISQNTLKKFRIWFYKCQIWCNFEIL